MAPGKGAAGGLRGQTLCALADVLDDHLTMDFRQDLQRAELS